MTNGTVNAWTATWKLIEHEIVCVECKRRQHLAKSEAEFKHLPGCNADPFARSDSGIPSSDVRSASRVSSAHK